jgi:hypothetical protein
VLGTELVGRALEVAREIFDCLEVEACCSLSVITTLEFLEHHFAKVGHRSSPYDPTLSLHLVHTTAADTQHAKASAAKRLRCVLGIAQQLGGESPLPDLMEVKG